MMKLGGLDRKNYQRAKDVRLIRGGKEFFSLLEESIRSARSEIHFQFYILEADETGLPILQALMDQARAGVDVYVVLDLYGSGKLDRNILNDMENAGVQFKWFKPVITFSNMEFGRRMHHKIVSIDERLALTTGVNIANRYNDIKGIPAWLDFALFVEGATAEEIKRRCLQIWEKPYELKKRLQRFRLPKPKSPVSTENALVKVSVNDWLRGRNDIYNGYRKAIGLSKTEVFIAGGYFLPGRMLRRALREASERGVNISVILTHFSDVRFAKPAEEYLYRWMFKRGINIYEWKPNIMHGKVAVVDQCWSTVGSFNLNYLSTFESLELNMEIIDENFSTRLNTLLREIAQNECIEVTEDEYLKKYSLRKHLKNWISFIFVRYSFRVLNLFSQKPKTN